jgi:hypothetical protein
MLAGVLDGGGSIRVKMPKTEGAIGRRWEVDEPAGQSAN